VVAMLNPLGSSAIRGRPAVGDRPTGWTLDPDPLAEVQTPGQVPRASDARVKRNSLARRSTVDRRQRLDERVQLQRVVPRSHAVTGMRRSSGETRRAARISEEQVRVAPRHAAPGPSGRLPGRRGRAQVPSPPTPNSETVSSGCPAALDVRCGHYRDDGHLPGHVPAGVHEDRLSSDHPAASAATVARAVETACGSPLRTRSGAP